MSTVTDLQASRLSGVALTLTYARLLTFDECCLTEMMFFLTGKNFAWHSTSCHAPGEFCYVASIMFWHTVYLDTFTNVP